MTRVEKRTNTDHTAEVYRRTWTPAQHYAVLHGNSPKTRTIDISVKLKTPADRAFWQAVEDRRFSRLLAGREARKAAGVKRLGGMPKRKDFAAVPPGQIVPFAIRADDELLSYVLDNAASVSDTYINQNSFTGWRKTELCQSISKMYIDLDDVAWLYELTHEQVAAEVLLFCDFFQIPRPSYIMHSGVGLNLIWLHSEVKNTAECIEDERGFKHWKEQITALFVLFQRRFHPDPAAKDLTRIFRLAGTVNSKSGAHVHPIYVSGGDEEPTVYDYARLSQSITLASTFAQPVQTLRARSIAEINAKSKAESEARKAAKEALEALGIEQPKRSSKKKAKPKKAAPAQAQIELLPLPQPAPAPVRKRIELAEIEAAQVAQVVKKNARYAQLLSDIYKLVRHRGSVSMGWRDEFLFCVTVCLARGGYKSAALENEVHKLVPHSGGLERDEAIGFMQSAMNRADSSEPGKDQRYNLPNAHVRQRLRVTAAELAQIDFATMHRDDTADERRAVNKARQQRHREKTHAPARAARAEAHAARDQHIAALSRAGMSVRQIAEETGLSKSAVSRILTPPAPQKQDHQRRKPQQSTVPESVTPNIREPEIPPEDLGEETWLKYRNLAVICGDLDSESSELPEIYAQAWKAELRSARDGPRIH